MWKGHVTGEQMKDIETAIRMIRQELYIITPRQKRMSLLLFMIIFVGSLFELLGVTAILPLVEALMDMQTFCGKWYIAPVIHYLGLRNERQIIYTIAVLIIAVYIVKNIYLLWSMHIQYRFRFGFERELSTRMLSAYLRRPYEYFLNINSAQILRSIEGDVTAVFTIYDFFFRIVAEACNVILIGVFLLCTDWIMALGVLTLSGLCFVTVTLVFKHMLKGVGEKHREADILKKKYAYQAVNGIKEINVMKRNDFFIHKYEEAYKVSAEMERKSTFLAGSPEKVIEISCIAGLVIIICLRVSMGIDPQVFVPQLSVFAVSAFRILPSISKLAGYVNGLMYKRPALEAAYVQLHEVEEYEEILKDYTDHKPVEKEMNHLTFRTSLEIKNICWKYPKASQEVIRDLSLVIRKGDAIGFIGPSGAGKTTLSDLIMGLFKPQKGCILMDGIDIYTIPKRWAEIIGYVPQTVYLTDDTLRNNISFGIEEEEIDDEKVWYALEQAQLKEHVMGLPDGLDTIVGERGVKFSGGQRQRVAIARALYYNPEILVLDEATSALDNETENAVMAAIDSLQKKKTLIIVAHRLSTIKNCDRVYEVRDGQIFEVDKALMSNT